MELLKTALDRAEAAVRRASQMAIDAPNSIAARSAIISAYQCAERANQIQGEGRARATRAARLHADRAWQLACAVEGIR